MTDQEARKKHPNVAKLTNFISRQDRQTQYAATLLLAAMAVMNGETVEDCECIDGMCCDCLHEREPFCGDYNENITCPDRKEDGSCWAGGENHGG